MKFGQVLGAALVPVCALMLAVAAAHSQTLDKVSFGTN